MVIPHSVSNSIGKKNNNIFDGFVDGKCAQKQILARNIPTDLFRR
jgi:hypothetical protein